MIFENYWIYRELAETGRMTIHTCDINKDNWEQHEKAVFNIMLDSIELEESRQMFTRVVFDDGDSVELSLYDYWLNLVFWYMQVAIDKSIQPEHLFFEETITIKTLQSYINQFFVLVNRKYIDIKYMNNVIDTSMFNFVKINAFAMYLANTINMSDFLALMDINQETWDIIHIDLSNVPLADVKKAGMEAMNRLTEIIKNHPEHCLSNFIKSGEGLNKKQAKEVMVNIGTKPDGQGGIFPYQINTNYFMGGVKELVPFFMETSVARIAQIIINKNVGNSGYFSRLIGLNNLNSKLHDDPNYVCDTHPSNFQKIYIENIELANSMVGQYYRFEPYGMEYEIQKDDKNLVGKYIYKRSPMTCASAARGEGICYRCYGDLAYVTKNINIGKIAAEIISAIIIQRMLSAKHLIEAEVIKMEWQPIFYELFESNYNLIELIDDKELRGYKLSINLANKYTEDDDIDEVSSDIFSSSTMNEYINEFEIITPDGEIHKVSTTNYDNIYLTPELEGFIDENKKKIVDDVLTVPLSNLQGMSLFAVRIQNNDLVKALDKVTNILDKTSEIQKYDKNSILQKFLMTVQECNINVSSTHCEVLLMNQIRKQSDIKEKPDWTIENQQDYQILALKKSLETNPSVTISLMFQDIKKMFTNPLTFEKTAPGITDLFFMEHPQEYMSEEYVEKLEEEQNKELKQVIYYKW